MAEDSTTREQGIDFGQFANDLESESYPIRHEELIRKYGDCVLELEDGQTTVREVLEPETEETYDSEESVRQTIFAMVGRDAVGREEYSDRGGNPDVGESNEESI